MIEWIELLGVRAWEGLWLPVFVWTAPATLVWLVARSDRLSAGIRIHLVQATLVALPAAILLTAVRRASTTIEYTVLSVPYPAPVPASAPATTSFSYTPDPIWTALGLLTVTAAVGAAIGVVRLAAAAVALMRLRSASQPVDDPDVDRLVRSRGAAIGFGRDIEIRSVPDIGSPMSAGILRPLILVPDTKTDDLDLIVLHELIHHRRRDVFRALVARLIRAAFFIHPLAHLLCTRLDALVEIDCDSEVVSTHGVSRKAYATLLVRYAVPESPELLALKLGTDDSLLKRRLEAMQYPAQTLRSHPVAVILGLLLLGAVTTFAACTDSFVGADDESAESTLSPKTSETDEDVFVIVEEMPTLIGGLSELQSRIEYPDLARRAGVEGRVYVQFVVSTDGVPEDIVVTRGIGAGADQEAVRAVSTMRFEPGRQRGRIVPVKMSLPVTFRLDGETTESTSMVTRAGLEKISGRVVDAEGNPIQAASIQLEGTERGAATDENGNFFVLAEPGEYDIRVVGPGYESMVFESVDVRTGTTRQLDVTLNR